MESYANCIPGRPSAAFLDLDPECSTSITEERAYGWVSMPPPPPPPPPPLVLLSPPPPPPPRLLLLLVVDAAFVIAVSGGIASVLEDADPSSSEPPAAAPFEAGEEASPPDVPAMIYFVCRVCAFWGLECRLAFGDFGVPLPHPRA